MRNKKIIVIAALAFAIQIQATIVGQQFQKDATWVPESANVIAMVRIQDMLDSELGKKEKWRSKQYHSFKDGLATLPTTVNTLLLGAQVDLEYLHPMWQVAVLKKDEGKVDLNKVKERTKNMALPAQFGSRPALCVRSDAYLVQVANDTLVSMEPANRQMTARWLDKHDPNKTTVSPYLQEAIKFANSSSHFIVAIDMADAVDVDRLKVRLANSPMKIEKLDAVVEALGSIKGLQMAIKVTDKINGAIKVDFKANTAVLEPYAKTFLLKALERNGFMVNDFNDWKMSAKPGALVLEGTLSNEGFNEVASMLDAPLTKGVERAIEPGQTGGDPQARMVETTKAYLDSVKDYMVQLSKKKGTSIEYKAKFFEKYAYQIDGMYSQDIDPIALDFGRGLANAMREMSASLRQKEYQRFQNQVEYGVGYERNAEAANQNDPWAGWNNGWNGYGPRYGKYTTERVRDQRRINNFSYKEVQMKMDVMRTDVTQKYADVKVKLTEKYNTKF